MWGLREKPHAVARGPGMFPTHVGIARIRAGSPHRPHDVPYACGDCAPCSAPLSYKRKCSLRMWGLRGRRRAPCAGSRYVPYACGDCATGVRGCGMFRRCSLRMWGLRVHEGAQPEPRAMFPTHVGIARHSRSVWRRLADVPYACGDCARDVLGRPQRSACSLRMWGLRGYTQGALVTWVMFPTHVGIARPRVRTFSSHRNVPYACGDCALNASEVDLRE